MLLWEISFHQIIFLTHLVIGLLPKKKLISRSDRIFAIKLVRMESFLYYEFVQVNLKINNNKIFPSTCLIFNLLWTKLHGRNDSIHTKFKAKLQLDIEMSSLAINVVGFRTKSDWNYIRQRDKYWFNKLPIEIKNLPVIFF